MPATALNFNTAHIVNQYGWGWVGLAIPAAGARITLFTDGSPDATANPNAKHLGHTTEGWSFAATPEVDRLTADEAVAPIKVTTGAVEASIQGNIIQLTDLSGVQQYLVQGMGTYGTAVGYEQITLGLIAVTYTAAALIWPTEADATKFVIYNLYKAINVGGLGGTVRRRQLGSHPVNLSGIAITTRAAADQLGNYWKQIP